MRVRILSMSRMITRAATPLIKMMTSDSIPPATEAVSCPPLDVASSIEHNQQKYHMYARPNVEMCYVHPPIIIMHLPKTHYNGMQQTSQGTTVPCNTLTRVTRTNLIMGTNNYYPL